MNVDDKIIRIQDNLARLPQLSKREFEILRAETENLIKDVEDYLDIDHLEIDLLG